MIIYETRNMMIFLLIGLILAGFLVYFGLKNDESFMAVPAGIISFALLTVLLWFTMIDFPYKISNDVEKIMLNKIPESSEFYRYEEGKGSLQYLDDSYTVQTVDIHSNYLKVQFKDDVKEPYMEMQSTETFLGKDLGPYKVNIYLPK